MKKIFLVFVAIGFTPKAHAVVSMQEIAKSSLRFIAREQVTANGPHYVAGEWPTWVSSTLLPFSLGVGRLTGEPEPTAFTTASVANELAVIYQQYPKYKQIPPLIVRAQSSYPRYREGALYNFYPPKIWRGVRVHQAAAMTLRPRWKGFTNIPQDADTSSTVFTSRLYAAQLTGSSRSLSAETLNSFSRFRDRNRKAHFYNRRYNDVETGAFMTWQYDENDPAMPRYYFAQPEEGPRIPFNRNDIDCVVNMNVLRVLALSGNSDIPGRKKSCEWLNKVSENYQYATCGIYYPNTYNFSYSAAQMDLAGETCLRPQGARMVKYILQTRLADGAWINRRNARPDRVQATAFAMLALARFADFRDQNVRLAMRGGANFLYRQKRLSKAGDFYWKGEVFFTDTAIARSLVNWRSHSFTTAVALHALLEANRRVGWEAVKALDHKP